MIIFTLISGIISGINDIDDLPAAHNSDINYSGEEWFVIFKFIGSLVIAVMALSLLISGIVVIFTGLKTNKDKKLSALIGGGLILAAVIGAVVSVMLFSNAFDLDLLNNIFNNRIGRALHETAFSTVSPKTL